MIKAVFFDIDGTIQTLTNPPSVNASSREALTLLKQKGIKTFIATGRSRGMLDDFIKLIDFEFDGWVIMNGQYCYSGGEVIRSLTINSSEIDKAIDYLQENNITCIFAGVNHTCKNMNNEELEKKYHELKIFEVGDLKSFPIYQLVAYIKEDQKELEQGLFDILKDCKSARWISEFMDVIPKDGGKNKGIDAMIEHFNIDISETMAFGDGGNDIDMLKHVGLSVAMGNAKDEVKQAANYVTSNVDDDGIYKALKHFEVI